MPLSLRELSFSCFGSCNSPRTLAGPISPQLVESVSLTVIDSLPASSAVKQAIGSGAVCSLFPEFSSSAVWGLTGSWPPVICSLQNCKEERKGFKRGNDKEKEMPIYIFDHYQ